MTRYLLPLLALYLPLLPPAHAKEPIPARLVKDLNRLPGEFTADIQWLASLGPDRVVFNLTTQDSGSELWTSDGSLRGTRLLKEFIPGSLGGNPESPVSGGGKAMVRATDAHRRPQLWITDGTAQGTVLIATLAEGQEGELTPLVATSAGGFYFKRSLAEEERGDWLWFTDGTPEGTRPVTPQDGNGNLLFGSYGDFTAGASGDTIYFNGWNRTVWRCDGTRESTIKIVASSAIPEASENRDLTLAGQRIYLSAYGFGPGPNSSYLWSFTPDGADFKPVLPPGGGGEWSWIDFVAPAGTGNDVYLAAVDTLGRRQLLWTDGTPQGTREIPLVHTDGKIWEPDPVAYFPMMKPVIWRGSLYFAAEADEGGRGLWVTDGTPAGTRMLRQSSPLGPDAAYPIQITAAGGRVYFQFFDGWGGSELWSTDGTPAGTRQANRSGHGYPMLDGRDDVAVTCRGELCFISAEPGQTSTLWRTAAEGRKTLRLTKPEQSTGSAYEPFYGWWSPFPAYEEVGGKLVSMVRQGSHRLKDSRLLRIDPAVKVPAGRGLFKKLVGAKAKPLWTPAGYDSEDGSDYVDGARLVGKVNGRVIFTAGMYGLGREQVWATDGSRRGTRLLKEYREFPDDGFSAWHLSGFVPSGGHIYFTVSEMSAESDGLWRTDGTPEGTVKVPLPEGMMPAWSNEQPALVDFNGVLYFPAQSATGSAGLWKLDAGGGAAALVKDGWHEEGDEVMNLTAVGDRLTFAVYRPNLEESTELWTTDGTAAGTRQVQPDPAGARLFKVGPGFDLGGLHIFPDVSWNNTGLQWWRSDGTDAGTYPLLPDGDFQLPIGPESAAEFGAVAGGKLFYAGLDWPEGEEQQELWVTDGTAQGTRILDVVPGRGSSGPSQLLAVGDVVYFAADHPDYGYELWRSDGTAAGTVLAADIEPGPLSSFPEDLKVMNGKLYFHAQRPAIGRELFSIDLE